MSMTKKQINAMMEIMDIGAACGDKAERCLEKTDGNLYQCVNGFVGVVYHEEIPPKENWRRKRTVFNEIAPHEPEELFVLKMIQHELDQGDYAMVTGPFPGEVQVSKLAKQMRENLIPNPNSTDSNKPKVVELTAKTEDGKEYVSIFNPRYIRLAVEAVGGKPRLYLGNSMKERSYKFLIVDSGPSVLDIKQNNIAIVMPIWR